MPKSVVNRAPFVNRIASACAFCYSSIVRLGSEILVQERRDLLEGRRIGVLAHAASVDSSGRHLIEAISADSRCKITALFGPEHGFATRAQDMEPVASRDDQGSGLPVFSLYGDTLDSLSPTTAMLREIDVLVVDLQDIGSRYYTYTWTALLCTEACATARKPIIVCDRPNPIGGTLVEGLGIDEGFQSFVGLYSIPNRHGMTLGEIVQFVNSQGNMGADLTVVQMDGWQRGMNFGDTGLKWVNPSPNIRSYTAALLYPGMCLVEATNISEGRGTDTPFEIVGAPYFDSEQFIKEFEALSLPGIKAAPTSFIPTRQKWEKRVCRGVRWVITDEREFRPYLTGLAFVWLAHRLYDDLGFEWRSEPYEFVTNRRAIDLLTGSSRFRERLASMKPDDLRSLSTTPKELLADRATAMIYK
jgi:uncharacterized protein YbbC (DUF1343 family)